MPHRREPTSSRRALTQRAAVPLSPSARLRCDGIIRLLEELRDTRSFLEVGCGQGGLALILSQHYEYVGYEPDEVSFRVARERLSRVGHGSVLNRVIPETPERTFDVVGAFEVLEHQADDRATLASWVQWVRPGGYLLVSVPAHPHRFGAADRYVGHFRRYTRDGLRNLLEAVGLEHVQVIPYGFPLGYVLEWARNRILAARPDDRSADSAARTLASGRRLQPAERLAPLVWVATLPFRMIQRPFSAGDLGTGFVARAQRPARE